ncbi:succinate dehydrogenase, cytochrome b556 subunit [Thioflexithrix psekupsensis]|uniref:Succinate dehydrogenase cytochrome b556 subunit n=1 Tax=Thioflexithrix psekupsensis TaxID=1570016 RepID=A0A251X4J8_9GAMM|nr:succinate dehydrogenase, cytochrome b556 subunit [Thioflexithrix psekupsensis]OUD12424.1 succinate dehydrogenase, cytochrome b556 subunit [Thioflexithrix psekupsensis]
MAVRKRPLSPHLQIYKMPLTAGLMSITHRITGVALAAGTLVLTYWLLSIGLGEETYQEAQAALGSIFGLIVLFGWTLALFYHLFNGIRHLFWDAAKGIDLKSAHLSGLLVLASASIVSVLVWIAAWVARGGA